MANCERASLGTDLFLLKQKLRGNSRTAECAALALHTSAFARESRCPKGRMDGLHECFRPRQYSLRRGSSRRTGGADDGNSCGFRSPRTRSNQELGAQIGSERAERPPKDAVTDIRIKELKVMLNQNVQLPSTKSASSSPLLMRLLADLTLVPLAARSAVGFPSLSSLPSPLYASPGKCANQLQTHRGPISALISGRQAESLLGGRPSKVAEFDCAQSWKHTEDIEAKFLSVAMRNQDVYVLKAVVWRGVWISAIAPRGIRYPRWHEEGAQIEEVAAVINGPHGEMKEFTAMRLQELRDSELIIEIERLAHLGRLHRAGPEIFGLDTPRFLTSMVHCVFAVTLAQIGVLYRRSPQEFKSSS
ncbi:hypothetical protein C8R44DRAFT_745730 [Mycena epipterygia]|nr:hypothetical protein C8R44DRAFT_745730 [Mycena epipterygia]